MTNSLLETNPAVSTAALLQQVEDCTLIDFKRLLYRHIERIEIRDNIADGTGRLCLSEQTMRFIIGVRGDAKERLCIFTHIVLYVPLVLHGYITVDEEEVPFFLPHAHNGAAGRFLEQHYSVVKRMFDARVSV